MRISFKGYPIERKAGKEIVLLFIYFNRKCSVESSRFM